MSGPAEAESTARLREHFDRVVLHDQRARRFQRRFRRELIALLAHHIPGGSRIVEWGCGRGDVLAALKPARGLGLELSPGMLAAAERENEGREELEFRLGDAHHTVVDEPFDAIVLDYLTGYLTDLQRCFENLRATAHPRTRLYITSLNVLWQPLLSLLRPFGWVMRQPPSNWLSTRDTINLLELSGWEVVHSSTEVMCPVNIPLLRPLLNRWLARLPFFGHLGSTLFLIARPRRDPPEKAPSCSVIVPVRNEAGNIRHALERVPELGGRTEIIFVEGNSTDDTWEVVQRETRNYAGPHVVSCVQQPGRGKWDAVLTGFDRAQGDILAILDGDLTTPPEDLPKFIECIAGPAAEFANGCRLIYPQEDRAMRLLNLFGNKFFALSLSAVLRQPVKDGLCGTKVLWRADWERLRPLIRQFEDLDPFGDFSLLFGAALLDLKIRDIPVRYRARTYGDTNISRFAHGWLLLKIIVRGLARLRFHRLS